MKKTKAKYFLILVYSFLLYVLAYHTERANFKLLISLFLGMSFVYLLILKWKSFSIKEIIFFGILLRSILLFHEPNLSDDYYRFLWDGKIITTGENPYLSLPSIAIKSKEFKDDEFMEQLFHKMNSPNYHTVYPPVNQAMYSIAVFFCGDNIFIGSLLLKVMLLLFEIGVMFILFKLLKQLKKAHYLASIYVFNPLVIVEVVGNIHFEGVMVFFLLASIYLLLQEKIFLAAVLMGFAVNVKLLPLMFLPLFINYIGWEKSIKFYAISGISILLMFLPFYNPDIIENMGESVNLYFQNFEFNASVHYVIRYVSLIFFDSYKFIGITGYLFSFLVFGFVLYKTFWVRRNAFLGVFQDMQEVLFLYFVLASTVHPWYIIGLVALAVFTRSSYVLIWSMVVVLSYFAYSQHVIDHFNWDKHESGWYFGFIFLEYTIVFGVFILSIKSKKLLSWFQNNP